MKGRYAGSHMTTYGYILPGSAHIARWASRVEGLSPEAHRRLKIIDWHNNHNQNISLTARHFGLCRQTVRRWLGRLSREGPRGLNDHSSKPKKVRQPTTPFKVVQEIVRVRKENPTWSKYKIEAYLQNNRKIKIPCSSIGRVLKRRDLIKPKVSQKRRKAALNPKKRYPRDLVIKQPGDFVQMDTKHLRGVGGIRIYQFTAIDVLTKVRVLHVSSRISSKQGEKFLGLCLNQLPFKIKAIQTDNGLEFLRYFDQACQKLEITHYFTEARSPKQNSYVERSIRTDKEEFYQQGNMRSSVKLLAPLLKEWQNHYNTVRPHQALNYLTPEAYYQQFRKRKGKISTKEFIPLQT